jgi:hypothetical protein
MLLLLDQTGAAAMRVAAAVHMPRMVLHGSNLPGRGGVQHLLVLATFVQKAEFDVFDPSPTDPLSKDGLLRQPAAILFFLKCVRMCAPPDSSAPAAALRSIPSLALWHTARAPRGHGRAPEPLPVPPRAHCVTHCAPTILRAHSFPRPCRESSRFSACVCAAWLPPPAQPRR